MSRSYTIFDGDIPCVLEAGQSGPRVGDSHPMPDGREGVVVRRYQAGGKEWVAVAPVPTLDDALRGIEAEMRERLAALDAEAEKAVAERSRRVKDVVVKYGKRVCGRCDGHGKVIRLDAAVMQRFGLRPWDGCPACGGELDRPGRGYTD